MFRSKTVAYNDLSGTSKEMIRNFCRMLSDTLINTYYTGGKEVLTLSPNEEVNNLMRYFINELFSEWGGIQYFDDAVITINLQATGSSTGIIMNVRYEEHGRESIVSIRNFDNVCMDEYKQTQTVASIRMNKPIMLGAEDLLYSLKNRIHLRYSKNH